VVYSLTVVVVQTGGGSGMVALVGGDGGGTTMTGLDEAEAGAGAGGVIVFGTGLVSVHGQLVMVRVVESVTV
jgi:hypothetical protein